MIEDSAPSQGTFVRLAIAGESHVGEKSDLLVTQTKFPANNDLKLVNRAFFNGTETALVKGSKNFHATSPNLGVGEYEWEVRTYVSNKKLEHSLNEAIRRYEGSIINLKAQLQSELDLEKRNRILERISSLEFKISDCRLKILIERILVGYKNYSLRLINMVVKQMIMVFLFSVLATLPAYAVDKNATSIMVSAFADSDFTKIDVIFTKFESTPKSPEFLPGEDVKVISYKKDGSVFEEKVFNFASFTSPFPCKKDGRKGGKCKPLTKQLVVFMNFDSSISIIKFFFKNKEISSAKVPRGLVKYNTGKISAAAKTQS